MSSVSIARSATDTRGHGRGGSNPRTPTPVNTQAMTRSNARIVEINPTLVSIPESDSDLPEGEDGDHDPAAPSGGPPGGDPEDADIQDPYGLTAAISAGLAQELSNALRLQAPHPKPKAQEPDVFNGSNSCKLNNFLTVSNVFLELQGLLYNGHPNDQFLPELP